MSWKSRRTCTQHHTRAAKRTGRTRKKPMKADAKLLAQQQGIERRRIARAAEARDECGDVPPIIHA
jgi:hypothetical protein